MSGCPPSPGGCPPWKPLSPPGRAWKRRRAPPPRPARPRAGGRRWSASRGEVSAAETHSRQAERRLRAADQQLARAEAALEQARGQLLARQQARDEAVCSRCGQPIDPEHIARELRDAEAAVTEASERLAEAQAGHEQAQGEEEAARQSLAASQAAEQEARDRLRQAEQRAEQAAQARSRLDDAVSCGLRPAGRAAPRRRRCAAAGSRTGAGRCPRAGVRAPSGHRRSQPAPGAEGTGGGPGQGPAGAGGTHR